MPPVDDGLKWVLGANDVGRAGALGGLFDVKFDVYAFFEVQAANVLHVEENVIIRILSGNKSVAANVVEEINLSVCHCKQMLNLVTVNASESRSTTITVKNHHRH
jgi:hypothetical protein